jgi:hypothetical protein
MVKTKTFHHFYFIILAKINFIYMLIEKILYTLNDITILPTDVSEINSRREVNPYYDINGK